MPGTNVGVQYAMAGNRVYDEYTWVSYQKLMLRNYPIANPLGDNFWDVDLRLSQILSYDWAFEIEYMHIEHGSTNVSSPYEMPWLTDPNITISTGYQEPFPYGIIMETNLVGLNLVYQPHSYIYGALSLVYSRFRNRNYSQGADSSQLSFKMTFYYNFSHSFLF